MQTLKKDHTDFARLVFDRRAETLGELEVKNKPNNSLRALFDYIGNYREIADAKDRIPSPTSCRWRCD